MLKRLPQDQLEDESLGAVATFFNGNGWEFNRQTRDKSGIDGEIEIVHGIERTGLFLKCQVKAGSSYITSETESLLRIRIERKYLEHWAKMTVPVLLLFYHPITRIIYWKAVRQYLDLHPSLLMSAGETCLIIFDKDQDQLGAESLATLEAVEKRTFSYDNILIDPGRAELGWSNWFPVKGFPALWEAATSLAAKSEIDPQLNFEYTFTIREKRLLTFSNIQDSKCELRALVDVDSIRAMPLENVSGPVLVDLLNQALGLFAKAKDLISRRDRFYFSPLLLKKPDDNKYSYLSLKGREETRTKIYIQRSGTRVEYKHHAVRLSFLKHLSKWYLQVDPDWYFTYPYGNRPSRAVVGARITSEKAATYNKDYLYLLHFWRQFLSEGKDSIGIRCSEPADGSTVDISSMPMQFDFQFRLSNDYFGPKVTRA